MPTYRVHKTENYTVMSNYHLHDKRLTLKAKGLLSLMLSLPPEWKHSITGFTAICKEGKHSITSAFNELEECGYVTVEKKYPRKGNGRIEYIYNIYEVPVTSGGDVSAGTTTTQFSDVVNQGLENPPQLNTNNKGSIGEELQVEVDSQVDSSSTSVFLVGSGFAHPTVEEVRSFCATNMLDKVDPELFVLWHEARGWEVNGTPIVNWEAAAKSWHVRDRNKLAADSLAAKRAKPDYSDLNEGWRTLDGTN